MNTIKATWVLFRDSARDTAKAMPRSGPAFLFLLLAAGGIMVLSQVVGGMGFMGGIIIGTTGAYLCGTYMALLRILVVQNRKLFVSDIREVLGDHFSLVIAYWWIFGLIRMVISMRAPEWNLMYVPLVAVLFNPIPEIVYQEQERAFESLSRALKFMGENWPEWAAIHAILFAPLVGLVLWIDLGLWRFLVEFGASLYGPWFGFFGIGPISLSFLMLGGSMGLLGAAVLFIGSHLAMVFRGQLYKRLARSNRRGRAWQARVG